MTSKRWLVLSLVVVVGLVAAIGPGDPSSVTGVRADSPGAEPSVDLCWRLGYDAMKLGAQTIFRYPEIRTIKAGVYMDWQARLAPARPNNMEYIQTIRVHQTLACGSWWAPYKYRYECPADEPHCILCPYADPPSYRHYPSAADIVNRAKANPGSTWQIGNEMDRTDYCYGNMGSAWCGQDEMLPELYAVAFHDLRELIKTADPTAKIAVGAIIEATPLRLQYLTRVWDEYLRLYGEPLPVDVWNTHNFLLKEVGGYGASTPPGFDLDDPDAWSPANDCSHMDMVVFDQFIRAYRSWMKERGQEDKPLIVTEFGVLYKRPFDVDISDPMAPCGSFDSALLVQQFMIGAFEYFRNTRDCDIGHPGDECRLVQRWLWYSLDDSGEGSNFNGHTALFNVSTLNITSTGRVYRDYCTSHLVDLGYPTPTPTMTSTPTATDTPTVTPTSEWTATPTPTDTPTPTSTPTATATPTDTPTRTPTVTETPTGVPTNSPTASSTATATPELLRVYVPLVSRASKT